MPTLAWVQSGERFATKPFLRAGLECLLASLDVQVSILLDISKSGSASTDAFHSSPWHDARGPLKGYDEQGKFYHVGGFKGARWYNKQLDKIRSKRDRCKKKSRRNIHLSKVYRHVSERKRHKQRDSLHKASHLISHKLVESTVVVGDLSQRQMATRQHQDRNKHLNRAVYNEWG